MSRQCFPVVYSKADKLYWPSECYQPLMVSPNGMKFTIISQQKEFSAQVVCRSVLMLKFLNLILTIDHSVALYMQ